MFVLLKLESNRKSVGDDGFGELLAGDWRVVGGDGLEDVALLGGRQWVHPREKHFAAAINFSQMLAGPLIILTGADDEFHLVARPKVFEVAIQIPLTFAAAGAFEVDDAMDARVDGGEVVRAAGF